jgi:hypothetical protein
VQLKDIFESLLGEKLLLKPGPNGWDLYAKLVGEAYMRAPKFEQRAVPHYQALIPWVEKMYTRIQSGVKIEPVGYHPYNSAVSLRKAVGSTGVMKVSTADADHAMFDAETNMKFRAVHDYMAHIQRTRAFSLQGEIASYNDHMRMVPPKGAPALFTEVIGQISAFYLNGKTNQEQKICLLDGFDYFNIGQVDGYSIVNKQLVKKGGVAPTV